MAGVQDKQYKVQKKKKKPLKRKRQFTRKMQSKLMLMFIVLFIALFGLSYRLSAISLKSGNDYSLTVLQQQESTSRIIPYKRGDILDRNGTTLATSIKVYNMVLDPKIIISDDGKYVEPTLQALNQCFDYDMDELRELVYDNPNSSYYVYKKKLSFEQIKEFKEMQNDKKKNPNIAGVWFEEEYERNYPFSNLACSVVGFTASGNVGVWGLENYYNDFLNGINGREFGFVDSDNNMETTIKAASDGDTIISTIDFNIQTIVEKNIKEYVKEYKPENVAVIVANPNNGEILAMASDRSFDLNDPRNLEGVYYKGKTITKKKAKQYTDEQKLAIYNEIWRNFCISDTYEPGSTFKPISVAAALEEAKAGKEDIYECDGKEFVEDWPEPIKCHNTSGHGKIDLAQVLMYSCNDGMMQVAFNLGKEKFSLYQENMGFGMKTGIDLPGESRGVVLDEKDMSKVDLACYSFGQNFNATAIQMVSAFSSLINGGFYYEPHVVKRIVNANGGVVQNVEKKLVKQTATKDTCEFIKEALRRTITEGTGAAAAVEGYVIGGKTGTAQKHDKDKDIYVLSFIGYAPQDNPQVVCYAIVDTPDVDDPSSSAYASKLFSNVMSEVLPYLNIFKTEDTKKSDEKKEDSTKKEENGKKEETTKKDDGNNESQTESQTDNAANRDEKYNEPPLDNQMHNVPQESTENTNSTENTSSTNGTNGE